MRVLIVHDYGILHGGAEHMILTLREGLRQRGHDARFFSSTGRLLPLESQADYHCYGTSAPARRILQVANPWAAAGLHSTLREFKPDVVHVRMFLNQLSPLILPLLRGWPTLLHIANYELICPLSTKTLPDGSPCHQRSGIACWTASCMPLLGVLRALVQKGLCGCWWDAFNMIVANSHWVQGRLMAEGIQVHETVWNGVPVQPERGRLTNVPTVTFAGWLVSQKGVDVLLAAMARVVEAVPTAQLVIAGDGPQRGQLEVIAGSLGLTRHVRFLGQLSRVDLEARFRHAWVQAVPSRWEEPFGIVAAEAMMRGSAVVVSRTGGLTEQVVEGQTGYTVPPGDVDALAVALLRLLGDRDHAERVGQAAQARARAEFSEDRFVERFLELYSGLLTKANARPKENGRRVRAAWCLGRSG